MGIGLRFGNEASQTAFSSASLRQAYDELELRVQERTKQIAETSKHTNIQ